ncbi:phospholipase D-like domain-containing protein [Actinomadura sp. NPDC000929]|uniref:phospholipase D-like domain-containing protein n=1 Tax=Actinomadura sp. NPDC000929 TaxID=3154517 RepID=UPI003392FACD
MTETMMLFFPCDALPVRVRFGFGDGISPIEETALRLIAARANAQRLDVHELTELLGLSHRVVLDLLHDMWRQGYLTLDFANGTIGLSRRTAELNAAGRLDGLSSAESVEDQIEIMLDRIGGLVRPVPREWPQLDRDTLIHHARPELTLQDTPHSELFRALRHHFDQSQRDLDERTAERGYRKKRLLSASLAAGLRGTPSRKWLPVEVTAAHDPDSDRLIVRVTDREYPETRWEAAGAVLTDLVERHPNERFAQRLKALADRVPPMAGRSDLTERLDQLAEHAARAVDIAPGQRWNWHKELCREARVLVALLDQRYRREMTVEAITSKEHPDAIRSLIADARVQLVMVCPWVRYDTLSAYEADLAAARRRGVQVVVVWGMNHKDTLERMAENSLDSLARIPSTVPLVRSALPARTHAKAVICDDRRALVTSSNFLSTKGTRREAGLLVSAPDGRGHEVALNLLAWARAAVPDGPTSRKIICRAADFALLDSNEGTHHSPAEDKNPDEAFPVANPDIDLEDTGHDRIAAWSGAWTAYAEGLRTELAARTLPSVDTVTDGRHRELLWRAIGRAQRRLVIASDQISDDVVDDRFADALRRRLDEPDGPHITVVYDRERASTRGTQAVERLRGLAHDHPGRIDLRRDRNHAKAIVCDDELLIGSFNYLSYEGFRTLGSPHLQRSELSLWLTDPALAGKVASGLGSSGERDDVARISRPVPVTAALVDPALQRLLDPMLAAADEPDRLASVVAESVPTDDPWPALSALEVSGAAKVLRLAVPHALATSTPDHQQVPRWRRWLIQDLWERGRFVEAAVLRAVDPDDAIRPRPCLAVAAAARDTSACYDALFEALVEDPDDSESAALLVIASAEMVLRASYATQDLLSDLREGVVEPWLALGDLCRDYLEATGTPLTSTLLSSLSERDRHVAKEETAWAELDRALAGARQLRGKINVASKILVAFFRGDGPFGRLGEAVESQDITKVRAFLSGPLGPRGDIRSQLIDLINQTGVKVAPRSPALHSKLLDSFVLRLSPVVECARKLVKLAEEGSRSQDTGASGQIINAATALKAGLAELMPDLWAAASGLDPTERRLVRACLTDLTHVLDLEAAHD